MTSPPGARTAPTRERSRVSRPSVLLGDLRRILVLARLPASSEPVGGCLNLGRDLSGDLRLRRRVVRGLFEIDSTLLKLGGEISQTRYHVNIDDPRRSEERRVG